MRGNTITVRMTEKGAAHASGLYQYDYGQRMIIDGVELPVSYEVHFSNQEHGNSKTRIGDHTGVDIPDEYLLSGENVYVWLFLHDSVTDGETEYHAVIHVQRRAKPTDLEPTPVQQDAITQAIAALNTAVEQTAQDVIDAEAARDAAQAAVDQYNDMTAEATELPSGSEPTAEIDHTGDHPVLQLGIPKGEKGDPGRDADPADLIDDTAGAGVTDRAWSADKLAANFSLKADKHNPVVTGSISLDRKTGSLVGDYSVAVGNNVEASEYASFAEGSGSAAKGFASHAEGVNTQSVGGSSHTEGYETKALSIASHAEGLSTISAGEGSHAEGLETLAIGLQSHAEGKGTIASHVSQHVFGEYNEEDRPKATADMKGDFVEIVGNGHDSDNRSNARALDWNGNEYLMGDVYVNSDPDSKNGSKLAKLSELSDIVAVQDEEPENPLTEIWIPETQTAGSVIVATIDDIPDMATLQETQVIIDEYETRAGA